MVWTNDNCLNQWCLIHWPIFAAIGGWVKVFMCHVDFATRETSTATALSYVRKQFAVSVRTVFSIYILRRLFMNILDKVITQRCVQYKYLDVWAELNDEICICMDVMHHFVWSCCACGDIFKNNLTLLEVASGMTSIYLWWWCRRVMNMVIVMMIMMMIKQNYNQLQCP